MDTAVTTQNALVQFDNTVGVQEPPFSTPADASPNATANALGVPWNALGLAAGTATWARAFDRDGNAVSDGNVGLSTGTFDFELNTTTITIGLPVTLGSWVLTDLETEP